MATADPVYKTIVDVTTKGAGAFIDIFYKTFDSNRTVIHKFYRPSSRIVWNGNPYAGEINRNDLSLANACSRVCRGARQLIL